MTSESQLSLFAERGDQRWSPLHRLELERWFSTLTEKQIRRGTHRSTRQLEQAIRDYLDTYNADPTPFAWAKSADDILAS